MSKEYVLLTKVPYSSGIHYDVVNPNDSDSYPDTFWEPLEVMYAKLHEKMNKAA